MEPYKVIFDALEWQVPSAGARFKVFREGSKQLRLIEFTSEFVEPEWCEKDHTGIVLKGEMEIDFQGRVICYPEGSCILIPAGSASAHKARSLTPVVQLFLVEDVQEVIMCDKAFAEHFAADWIDSWNSHNLERILSHYTDDFEMSSPVIIKVAGEASGTLRGKTKVGAYWAKALERVPDLHFELIATLVGVNSVTLYYKGARGLAAEVFHFNAEGKVSRAYAHYET